MNTCRLTSSVRMGAPVSWKTTTKAYWQRPQQPLRIPSCSVPSAWGHPWVPPLFLTTLSSVWLIPFTRSMLFSKPLPEIWPCLPTANSIWVYDCLFHPFPESFRLVSNHPELPPAVSPPRPVHHPLCGTPLPAPHLSLKCCAITERCHGLVNEWYHQQMLFVTSETRFK